MEAQKQYGDEELGYRVLVRDMTPEQARDYLEINIRDGIYMQMPDERRIALHKRMLEGKLKMRCEEM